MSKGDEISQIPLNFNRAECLWKENGSEEKNSSVMNKCRGLMYSGTALEHCSYAAFLIIFLQGY